MENSIPFTFLSNACDHTNVFRFVNVDDPMDTIGERVYGEESIFKFQFDEDTVKLLAKEYDIPAPVIGTTVRDIVIYTYGLAVMMMFDNNRLSREEACKMVYDTGKNQLEMIGIKGLS
ncbi:MAG: hypothetical protein IK139_03740 [Lachnospiraceae bacterium]|nr:hypothetical protein [Lachnospiraceae bacterium]